MTASQRFPLAFDPAYRPAGVLFGVRPATAWVELRAQELAARYGFWSLRVAYRDIARVEVTGPYAYWKTAGPARLGVTDAGLSFTSNGNRGVLLTFRRPVRSRGPVTMLLRHPELTVTVADIDGFVTALRDRIAAS